MSQDHVEMMDHHHYRPSFQWLSFAYQDLTEIPYDAVLAQSASLEVLDLSYNLLHQSPALLGKLEKLSTLILDSNNFTSHVKFPFMPSITTVYINKNNISNLPVFVEEVRQKFPRIRILSMMNNKAAPSYFNGGTLTQYVDYRLYVISQIPRLEILDDTEVVEAERTQARRTYRVFSAAEPGRRTTLVSISISISISINIMNRSTCDSLDVPPLTPTSSEVFSQALTASFSGFHLYRHRNHVPHDPSLWSEAQVNHWLDWCQAEFGLPVQGLASGLRGLHGGQLCGLDRSSFLDLTSDCTAGEILWEHLDTMRRESECDSMVSPSITSTSFYSQEPYDTESFYHPSFHTLQSVSLHYGGQTEDQTSSSAVVHHHHHHHHHTGNEEQILRRQRK
ncbi:uncharacterized protein LOC114459656 isoform X2 [Gouania willdenowi]|uniref:uncharacterized protein LOC114459656 isoform X2 n=1 Tax=Gouania willdenowi TaxID=441366 RepID=UPI0010567A5E|nr:uncharacterized protein LOC114459656 isoform X2 [Gouania willdenowi]